MAKNTTVPISGLTVLRGVICYKSVTTNGRLLTSFCELFPQTLPKLRDMRPPTASGKLDLLEQLTDRLEARAKEGLHDEAHILSWCEVARRHLAQTKEAIKAGDIKAAVSKAIDAAMLVGDLAAEIHVRKVARDIKRQEGTAKGGKKSRQCKGILLAAGRLKQDNPDWSAQRAWNQLMRLDPDNPLIVDGYEIYADSDTLCQRNEITGDDRHIRKATFRSYWAVAS